MNTPRVLITGANGQLGPEIAMSLRKKFGVSNVICSDVRPPVGVLKDGPFEYLDVVNAKDVDRCVVNNNINWIVHFAALLSAIGEKNPSLLLNVNMRGTENVLESSKKYGVRCFIPSSIGAFGPTTPRIHTPDITLQHPNTIYGVSKVYGELLGSWYHDKFGVDFRCLRYPGIISWKTLPGGGTTDWACASYFDCAEKSAYECFVGKDTVMPLMYIQDCIDGTVKFLETPYEKLTQRTYNMNGVSFSPIQQEASIKKIVPSFKMTFKPDFRQAIADSWPRDLDDVKAQEDWGWKPSYDVDKMTEEILKNLRS